ncbi:MAG: hypothetical protein K6B75_07270 [Lachnospiraceae bacterium]|nr:hypothetical protein [Lachnospiraceae bacterium]
MREGRITFKQYRSIDIALFTALFVVSEAVVTLAANKWFPGQPYTFSLLIVFMCLMMMRWGLLVGITAPLGSLAFCICSGADGNQYLIYIVGNLFSLLAFFYIMIRGKDKIRSDALRTGLFVILTFVFTQAGRWLVAVLLGNDPLIFITFVSTDALSGVFALIAVLSARHIDGLFEDQKAYLFRLDRERKEKAKEES